MPILSLKG